MKLQKLDDQLYDQVWDKFYDPTNQDRPLFNLVFWQLCNQLNLVWTLSYWQINNQFCDQLRNQFRKIKE